MSKFLDKTGLDKLIDLVKAKFTEVKSTTDSLGGRLDTVEGHEGDYLPKAGGTMSGNITMDGNTVTGLKDAVDDTDAVTKKQLDAVAATAGDADSKVDELTSKLDEKLSLTGGTMSGEINMGNNQISGLANATGLTDAVNKAQLDAVNDVASKALTAAEAASGEVEAITNIGDTEIRAIWANTPAAE